MTSLILVFKYSLTVQLHVFPHTQLLPPRLKRQNQKGLNPEKMKLSTHLNDKDNL